MKRYNAIYTIELKDIEAESEEEAMQEAKDLIADNHGNWNCEVEEVE